MREEEEQKSDKTCSGTSCHQIQNMTETSPRDAIDGSELTDFIELGKARPWIDKADLVLQTCGIFLVGISFIKLGLVAKGFIFITMDGLTQVS